MSILLVDLVLDISLSIYSSVMIIIDKKQRICFFFVNSLALLYAFKQIRLTDLSYFL